MADAAEELRDAVEDYVERAVRPYAEALAALEAKYASDIADLRAQVASKHDDRAHADMIARMVAEAVAAIPKPRDGADGNAGRDGINGKDAIVEYDRIFVHLKSLVDAIPRARDGLPGERGTDGAPGKDGVVDYDRIGEVIAVAVDKAMANVPKPKDGERGKDGVVDYDIVREFVTAAVTNAVAELPPPKHGERGEKGQPGERGEKGEPGRDGKSVELSEVAPLVENAVAARFAALPAIPDAAAVAREMPLDAIAKRAAEIVPRGEPGPAGKDADEGAIIARVLAAIPKPENGRDGKDGRDGRDADEEAIVSRVMGLIPKPRDGIDGRDGKAGEEGPPGRDGRDGAAGAAGAPGEKGIDGKDGRDGWTPEDIHFELDEESSEIVIRAAARGRVVEKRCHIPILRDAGLHTRGKRYRKGDVVTYGGSAFVATRDTEAVIGGEQPSPDWRLLVKRGRDAS